ncbi:MAG: hypothetical protein JXR91_02790 [Deltaproteobacteria bacterium]|nr:hypothetical protein [Deltaproteobacteria bacterium]
MTNPTQNTNIKTEIPPSAEIVFKGSLKGNLTDINICGFTKDPLYGKPDSDGLKTVNPYNSYILYTGRINCSNPKELTFSLPAVTIKAGFTGTSIELLLKDFATIRTDATINHYQISIDDNAPFDLIPESTITNYPLAKNLSPGKHTIEIGKKSEGLMSGDAVMGKGAFMGFKIDGDAALYKIPALPNTMEFIGDSVTCGYGNEISVENPDNYHFTTAKSNALLSYGAITAKRLNARYSAVAISGRGLIRNNEGFDAPLIPEIYLSTIPEDINDKEWDIKNYTPEVIVINLGTNDFSEGIIESESLDAFSKRFTDAYITFVDRLRSYYPNAAIVIALGPMMSDFYPEGYDALTRAKKCVTDTADHFNKKGDNNVYKLFFDLQSGPYGEDWHPTVETHRQMSKTLIKFLKDIGIF